MPTYEYRCTKCEHTQDAFRSIAERQNGPECEECGSETKQRITAVNIGAYSTKVMEPFESPANPGKVITSHRAMEEDMKRSGCRRWEGLDQERKEVKRKSDASNAKLEKAVDENLKKQIAQMPTDKRKRLGL